MNMFRAFMELDSISESYDNFSDRQELIDKIKALGRHYYFDKYSNEQLYYIWKKELAKKEEQDAMRDYYETRTEKSLCDACGYVLTDGGYCPICDDGAEDLDEGIFDGPSSRSNWIKMPISSNASSQQTPFKGQTTSATNVSGKNVVTIVYDNKARKLRARADDGIHGEANVAFPNNLRTQEGKQYEVDSLIWNGKNYRVSGSINSIN